MWVPRGKVHSAKVEDAVPTELHLFLNCFKTTGCFRQCLPPGVWICHYKDAVYYVYTKRTEIHA